MASGDSVVAPWEAKLGRIRAVARKYGYAVAVHGSTTRDLDLIAAPWSEGAVTARTLVDKLCEECDLVERPGNVYDDDRVEPNPEPKPWGRWAWTLGGVPGVAYVDLSVMPRTGDAAPWLVWDAVRAQARGQVRARSDDAARGRVLLLTESMAAYSDARRQLALGGVRVDGQIYTEPDLPLSEVDEATTIQAGARPAFFLDHGRAE